MRELRGSRPPRLRHERSKAFHADNDGIVAVRDQLLGHGATASPVQDTGGVTYAYLRDPDGNSWALQEIGRNARATAVHEA